MSEPVILFEGVGKKFCRTFPSAVVYGFQDWVRQMFRLKARGVLRRDEFWALRGISLAVRRGECIGIIGPNGAGKSTLLKLVNRDQRPDRGRVVTRGRVVSLIRLGTGLQPMLTGRENTYVKCAEFGMGKPETDALLDSIVGFAGLEKSLDKPVKYYSDGMYARLEFSIAASVPSDILLVDEVLSVGDMAFQMRCLERLEQLKRKGTTILFVSHSEMSVRQIADRCLLLFDGEALALGETNVLFRAYYESVGLVNRQVRPPDAAPESPEDFAGTASVRRVEVAGQESADGFRAYTGRALALDIHYSAGRPVARGSLVLQFWNPGGVLVGSFDSVSSGIPLSLMAGGGKLRIEFPALGLTAGMYRVAGGFRADGGWLGYGSNLLRLAVIQEEPSTYQGLFVMTGKIEVENRGAAGSSAGR